MQQHLIKELDYDLIKVLKYLSKLPEQVDESTFTKRVIDAGVEGHCGVLWWQYSYPLLLKRG